MICLLSIFRPDQHVVGRIRRNAECDLREAVLPQPKGNPRDEIAAKAVLQAVEDFLAAIADDFTEPNAAVHGDEQCSFVQSSWLGVGGEVRIDEVVPDANDFGLGAAAVQTEPVQDGGHDVGDRFAARRPSLFQWRRIDTAPFAQRALAGARLRRTEWGDASGGKVYPVFSSLTVQTRRLPTIKVCFGN